MVIFQQKSFLGAVLAKKLHFFGVFAKTGTHKERVFGKSEGTLFYQLFELISEHFSCFRKTQF